MSRKLAASDIPRRNAPGANGVSSAIYELEPTTEEGAMECGCCPALAVDAVIACSQVPVLENFRECGYAMFLACGVIVSNVAALIGLTIYFLHSCSRLYGMLPNQWDMYPPALAALQSQEGVTIIKTQMIYFQAEETYEQEINGVTRTFWEPLAVTCGCDTCELESCQATVPLTVEYDQCSTVAEAIALSTSLMLYVNLVFTLLFVLVLWSPCWRRNQHKPPKFWEVVKSVF